MTTDPQQRGGFESLSDRLWALLYVAGAIILLILGFTTGEAAPTVGSVVYALLGGAYYGRSIR